MKLPLLDFSYDLFKESNFENILLISIQHILESNFIMFNYLFDLGLKPENTLLLGKCYSTNNDILKKFQDKGVYVNEDSLRFNSNKSFDEDFSIIVQNFIQKISINYKLKEFKKIILVDDGGFLISEWNKEFGNQFNVIGIEQTSSGYNKLKELNLTFPIINIARSNAKLKLESPFIAEKSIQILFKKILEFNFKIKKILIFGGGPIGRNLKILLNEKFNVNIYDKSNLLTEIKDNDLEKYIINADLIIGATGKNLNLDFNLLKKKVLLASVSSSDREFCAVNIRKKVIKINNCHEDIIFENVYLLNCGFPINFDGNINSVTPEKIQLTRALMFSGICLALKDTHNINLISLSENVQNLIIQKFLEFNIVSK